MASTDELRQILKEDQSGKNLYDHLTETLMKQFGQVTTDSVELSEEDVSARHSGKKLTVGGLFESCN